jgi:hypothetical protein
MSSELFGGEDMPDRGLGNGAGYVIINVTSEEGAVNHAAYFRGSMEKAVIFVPGAVFNKESWYCLAKPLQQLHISSLALDGKSKQAVLAAIDLLKHKGFKHLILVGGSMGGSAILDALDIRTDESISKIILLAPSGGSPVKSEQINKMFIVSKEDRLGVYPHVRALYLQSSEPKKIVEFDGSEHAQHLFKTAQKESLIKWIIDFVVEGE